MKKTMIEKIKTLEREKEKLWGKIKPIEEKIYAIDNQIYNLKKNCPHNNTKIIEIDETDYYYSVEECVDCGESWFR